MNTYDIYTYGGFEILREILQLIAIFFKSDGVYMVHFLKMFAVVGLTWVITRTTFKSDFFGLMKTTMMLVLLFKMLCVLPKSTVHLIDAVDLNSSHLSVEGVPMVIAATLSIPSRCIHSVLNHIPGDTEPIWKEESVSSRLKTDSFGKVLLRENIKHIPQYEKLLTMIKSLYLAPDVLLAALLLLSFIIFPMTLIVGRIRHLMIWVQGIFFANLLSFFNHVPSKIFDSLFIYHVTRSPMEASALLQGHGMSYLLMMLLIATFSPYLAYLLVLWIKTNLVQGLSKIRMLTDAKILRSKVFVELRKTAAYNIESAFNSLAADLRKIIQKMMSWMKLKTRNI